MNELYLRELYYGSRPKPKPCFYMGFDYYRNFLRMCLIQHDEDRNNAGEQQDKIFVTSSCQYFVALYLI